MEAGMAGYIAKPISLDEITTTLRGVVVFKGISGR